MEKEEGVESESNVYSKLQHVTWVRTDAVPGRTASKGLVHFFFSAYATSSYMKYLSLKLQNMAVWLSGYGWIPVCR